MRILHVAIIMYATVLQAQAQPVIFVNSALTTGANDGSSWANAFRGPLALNDALGSVVPPAQIWVAAGLYKPALPGGSRLISFQLQNKVSIFGGFAGFESSLQQRDPVANPTVLSGDLQENDAVNPNGPDNTAHVVRADNANSTAQIDGFTITAGTAKDFGIMNPVDRPDGGGILIVGGAPTVRQCTFTANNADRSGGGLCIDGADPLIEGCTFTGSRSEDYGSGAAVVHGGHGRFRNCLFEANIGNQGSGFFSGDPFSFPPIACQPLIEDCAFHANQGIISASNGGGICAFDGQLTIRRCIFIANFAQGGGGVFLQGAAGTIESCRFWANGSGGDLGDALTVQANGQAMVSNTHIWGHFRRINAFATGSPIIVPQGNLQLINCTLVSNGGAEPGAGPGAMGSGTIIMGQGNLQARNCIFWDNFDFQGGGQDAVLEMFPPSTASFDYCAVQGWDGTLSGANSFALDPQFIDLDGADNLRGTADDDLHLGIGSPCIDSGDPAYVPVTGLVDVDGQSPIMGCFVDRGADEAAYGGASPHSGDMNADGLLTLSDVPSFVAALLDSALNCPADLNSDGADDGLDLRLFVDQLLG